MKINKYPDNSSYVVLDKQGREGNTIFRINSYEDLWHLNQFVEVYNHSLGRPLITIPNLIDAQADRRFADNQSSGLKLVCNFLNNLKADFKLFHPHNAEVVEALMNNVKILDNTLFISSVLAQLNKDNLILFSSDAGGFKPLMKLCDKIGWKGETYSASKARTYKNDSTQLEQFIDRKDFKGKDVLIIDDISVHGGTFKGLSVMLKERNIGNIYLAVSHMTVQNIGDDPVTNYFDKVYTTNSKFDEYYTEEGTENRYGDPNFIEPKNLKVIKMF